VQPQRAVGVVARYQPDLHAAVLEGECDFHVGLRDAGQPPDAVEPER
jgi:hypothetical protein